MNTVLDWNSIFRNLAIALPLLSAHICFAQLDPGVGERSIRGTVVNRSTHKPLSEATVAIVNGIKQVSVKTDEKGRFEFRGVGIGNHLLYANVKESVGTVQK
jgi:hypothetical protein